MHDFKWYVKTKTKDKMKFTCFMHLPITFNWRPVLCKIKVQNGCWQKWLQKVGTWKGTKNLIPVQKLYCDAKYWRLGKMRWITKSKTKKKTTVKYIQFDAWLE